MPFLGLVVHDVVLGLGHVCTCRTKVEIRVGGSLGWALDPETPGPGRERAKLSVSSFTFFSQKQLLLSPTLETTNVFYS